MGLDCSGAGSVFSSLPGVADTGGGSLAFQSSFDRALGNPLLYSCLENPHGQTGLEGCSPRGHEGSGMSKATKFTHGTKPRNKGSPRPSRITQRSSSITQLPPSPSPDPGHKDTRMETRGWGHSGGATSDHCQPVLSQTLSQDPYRSSE